MKKITLFITLFLLCRTLFAIPAYPFPVTYIQPNGDSLTVKIKGDERIHWYETPDGYTLMFNQTGFLTYAQLDADGNLQPSAYIATNIDERDSTTVSFLLTIEKYLFYSNHQKQVMLQIWQIEDEIAMQNKSKDAKGLFGHFKTLCAFVQFPEKSMIKSIDQFEDLFNQLGYTGNGSGSVRDFFKESSYNQFDLTITLCGIYTTTMSEAYYAGSSGSANCPQLATWAAQQVAKSPTIDFRDYDSNNDGIVDGFHFIFAGIGQEAGGEYGTIWSHESMLSTPIVQNGKMIKIYSCSPELLSENITTIGVICHEMTHAFGAADFYDTDYETGGQFDGTGKWDIMATGSWNGTPGGNKPPHHNMYIKVQFGWVTPVILDSPTSILDMPNSAENPVTYRINTNTFDEYFLLENRQQIKFDSSVPGNGLIIYHVHSYLSSYGINSSHPQGMYPVCASSKVAIPNSDPSSYGNINSAGCPYPGTSQNSSFEDESIPSMKSWDNENTKKPITNITLTNRLISFDFMGGGCPTVSNISVNYLEDCSKAIINWGIPEKEKSRDLLWDNTAGMEKKGYYSVRWISGANNNRIVMADDFDILEDETWFIQKVDFYGYPSSENYQPEHIGMAIYKDNGNNRPESTPLFEDAALIPSEGIVSGNMTLQLSKPIILNEAGKYWLSVYGAFDGPLTVNKQYYVGYSSVPKGATLCRWDPQNLLSSGIYYPNWASNKDTAYPSMFFSISGYKTTGTDTQYNLYRDGVKIAGPLIETTYEDTDFNNTLQHTWGVAIICSHVGEGDLLNIVKEPCHVGIQPIDPSKIIIFSYLNYVCIQNETNYNLKSIEIFDIMGQRIYQNDSNDAQILIPLQVPNGIYFIKVLSAEGKIISKKILIRNVQ